MGERVAVDVVVDISYDFKDPSQTCIYTNARTEALQEILSSYIQDQIGSGADPAKMIERDVYRVKIGLVLESDSFCTEADTGNKGLTVGIVMDLLGRLQDKDISIKKLSERP